MSYTTIEMVWLEGMLTELLVHVPTSLHLYCDNISAHSIAEIPCFHERTKHLRTKNQKLDVHYVRENVKSGFLHTKHIKSALQLADVMTKPLGADQHKLLTCKLGLVAWVPLQDWPYSFHIYLEGRV
ncbi:Retrovirus-related Pol polyprotein from transposon RE1 [Bienertia sinuspersici]